MKIASVIEDIKERGKNARKVEEKEKEGGSGGK